MEISTSIVDYIAMKLGYPNISDLRHMNRLDRIAACRVVEKINPGDESLAGWNDALVYLVGEPPAKSQEEARFRLLQKLRTN